MNKVSVMMADIETNVIFVFPERVLHRQHLNINAYPDPLPVMYFSISFLLAMR